MATSKKQFEVAQKRAGIIADYKRTFSDGSGRNVLLDLIREHHVMASTFTDGPSGDRETILKEGERNVVLRILHQMNIDAEGLLKYIRETQEHNQFQGVAEHE